MNLIFGDVLFRHTVSLPEIEAVGRGLMVTIAEPVAACKHSSPFPSETLTNEYVKEPGVLTGTFSVAVFDEPLVVRVCEVPPLTVYVNVYGVTPLAPVMVMVGVLAAL